MGVTGADRSVSRRQREFLPQERTNLGYPVGDCRTFRFKGNERRECMQALLATYLEHDLTALLAGCIANVMTSNFLG